jgi:hypothetical protein
MLVALLCAAASAQTHKPFPGDVPNARTLRIQERVEELYNAGNYERALLIYQKELAPLGDKYAQYMVGYMHQNAQGTAQRSAEALAWYRLAAERGEPVLERVRDEMMATMSPAELAASHRIFVQLWKTIGDSTLLMELIKRDMNILRARTGTRIAASASSAPALVYRPTTGETEGPNFYRDIRHRLEARLNYIATSVEVSDLATQSELDEIKSLEDQVRQELAALELP